MFRVYCTRQKNTVVGMTGWNPRVGVRSIKHVELDDGPQLAVAWVENGTPARF